MIKKTKIIATIGPSSWDQKILKKMINVGLNAARINASFADHAELKRVSAQVRKISENVALIMDTKGHKIRVSSFKKEKILKAGEEIILHTKKSNKGIRLITESSVNLAKQIPTKALILIDDGLLKLVVEETKEDEIHCKVIQGGILKKSKSVNIPGIHIDFPELSKKDYNDILYAKKLNFDFIAASFIRNVKDLRAIKKLVNDSDIKIIAKIEDGEGVVNFDEILKEADGIMVARGDLGVEIPAEKVPLLQQEFIDKCNAIGKPVIVATQMLQSMVNNITPTRAEVNDVADAIMDGTDAIMLSAETSTGKYPFEAVKEMSNIALEIEKSIEPVDMLPSPLAQPTTNAIAESVIDTCRALPIDKIIVATASGTTAKTIARFRPKQPIFAFTGSEVAKRHLSISRGITADILEESSATRDTGVQLLVKLAKKKGHVSDSDFVIVVSGANIMGQGQTNMMEVNRVEQIVKP